MVVDTIATSGSYLISCAADYYLIDVTEKVTLPVLKRLKECSWMYEHVLPVCFQVWLMCVFVLLKGAINTQILKSFNQKLVI